MMGLGHETDGNGHDDDVCGLWAIETRSDMTWELGSSWHSNIQITLDQANKITLPSNQKDLHS
jgi:hypothetical protein